MAHGHPELPVEVAFTEAEFAFEEHEPPGIFPANQDSNFGLKRKIFSDKIQELADQLDLIFTERFPHTSILFLDEHEFQVGLPLFADLTDEERRSWILWRLRKGPFTRPARAELIERMLWANQGGSIILTMAGVELTAGGVPFLPDDPGVEVGTGLEFPTDGSGIDLSGDGADLSFDFYIIEFIDEFRYEVHINSLLGPDLTMLERELRRWTPAGINFSLHLH